MTEHSLVAAAKQGETTAFDAICQPHTKRLFQMTYRITRNREDAEDALQDSFLRAFVHIKEFDGRSSFSTWLTRIGINSALMILRKKRNSGEVSADSPNESQDFWQVADVAPNPERRYAEQERQKILRDAISRLRPAMRRVVQLQMVEQRSLKEAAAQIGISVPAVKARLLRARVALRKSARLRVSASRAGRRGVSRIRFRSTLDRHATARGIN